MSPAKSTEVTRVNSTDSLFLDSKTIPRICWPRRPHAARAARRCILFRRPALSIFRGRIRISTLRAGVRKFPALFLARRTKSGVWPKPNLKTMAVLNVTDPDFLRFSVGLRFAIPFLSPPPSLSVLLSHPLSLSSSFFSSSLSSNDFILYPAGLENLCP